jgi:hypothetical protein
MSKFLTIATSLIILFISVEARTDTSVNLSVVERLRFNEKAKKLTNRFNVPKRSFKKKSPRVKQYEYDDEEEVEKLSF